MRAKRPTKESDGRRSREETQSGDLQALTHKARRLGQTGKWGPEAVWVNTRILKLDPGNLAALTRRGRCYQEQGNFPAAKEDYFRALQIYPESTLVKEALGRIERQEKRTLAKDAKAGRTRAKRRVGASSTKGAQGRAAERARKEAEDLRKVEGLKSFEEAYSFGVAASKSSRPDYLLAIKAFRKAERLGVEPPPSPARSGAWRVAASSSAARIWEEVEEETFQGMSPEETAVLRQLLARARENPVGADC